MALRERKKRQTREALVGAATALGQQHGFDAVTVEQIADQAGVSRRTFFRYFDSKVSAFFAEQGDRVMDFRIKATTSVDGEDAEARVRRCLLELADDYESQALVYRNRHRIIANSEALMVRDMILDRSFEDAIIHGLGGTEWAHVRGCALYGVVRAALRSWYSDRTGETLRQLGERYLAMLDGETS